MSFIELFCSANDKEVQEIIHALANVLDRKKFVSKYGAEKVRRALESLGGVVILKEDAERETT